MQELYNKNILNDTIFKAAIYVRLSREDEKNGQSESIENQIKYLKPIVKQNGWALVDIYKDDGFTGTNFERPGFKQMLEDIEKGLVNLVITKDLSRLGRDYIETGNYIEKIFPSKNIRYIAVNDNIDTFDNKNSNNDMTPFKSVMNDMYAKDISNKVRTSIYTKAKEGECIKAFLPYGYKKDLSDKNKILKDENVADNIVLIYDLYKSGKNKTQIAKILNDKQIITPLRYKQETSNYFNPNKSCTYKWNTTIINKILRDRIYTGDLVQLKNNKVNYKVKKTMKVPSKQQIVIENNHEAIIDRKTFITVQEMLDKKSNEWNYSNRKRHLLTGLVYCKCGSKITYNLNHGKTSRCVCSSYKKYGNKFCSNIHLKEAELIEKVTKSLKENIEQYLNYESLDLSKIQPKKLDNKKVLDGLKKQKEEQNKKIVNLYEDKISGRISIETFEMLIKKFEIEKKEIEKKIEELEETKNNEDKQFLDNKTIKVLMKELIRFNTITENNISLVFKLIDKIIIDDKNIKINYKFKL